MKKNVFALLLAVLMVVSCMTLFVSADENGKAGYVPAASVPTIDGIANELAWGSTQAIDGVKTLWSDDGFYFAVAADVTFTVVEAEAATAWTVAVVGGAVTSEVKGIEYAASEAGVEIFVPYQYYTDEADVWTWYGFVQERTQGDHEDTFGAYKTAKTLTVNYKSKNEAGEWIAADHDLTIRIAIAGSKGDYKCPTTKANDLIGLYFTLNGAKVEFSMPYCVDVTTLNGAEYGSVTWWDDSQVTGVSRANREIYAKEAELKVVTNNSGVELLSFEPSEDQADKLADYDFYITTYDSKGNPLPRYGYMPKQLAYASYVAAEDAPVVDGVIDSVWGTTAKIYHYNEIDDPLWSAYGYIAMLWSDAGIYYLGSVVDTALAYAGTGMDDHININVTETWGHEKAPSAYAAELSKISEYGEYWFGIDPLGRVNDGSALVKNDACKFAGTIWADNAGYTIEGFVPYFTLTAETAVVGHIMGIESSVDDYRDPNGVQGRDEYTNLGGLSSYWSNPQSQFNVIFVGAFDYEEKAMSAADVAQVAGALAKKAQMKADALTADAVDMMISDYVDEALGEFDLSEYAKLSDIPAAQDLSGYAKKSDIPAAQDLSGYALKTEIPEAANTTLPVILAVVAIVVAAAGIVLQFVKKK